MNNFRDAIIKNLTSLLETYFPEYSDIMFEVAVVLWIILFAFVLHIILHKIVLRTFARLNLVDQDGTWLNTFTKHRFFHNLVLIVQCAVVQIQSKSWLEQDSTLNQVICSISDLAILFFGLLAIFAIVNSFQTMLNSKASKLQIPLRGISQTLKLILSLIFILLATATLLGKSPVILLSGIGALSAVLMLVFRDPIMGLVAGIQLSANNMLMIGDWLEMPKFNADGDVIDIGLTTVKVKNWDKTITSIPTYALISNSFKNWRGMSESGGRRIKRKVLISTSSIKFLDHDHINQLKKSNLLTSYLEEKLTVLEKENSKHKLDMSYTVNGRRLTNIGTFRHYLLSYLKKHPHIQQKMTLLVRQLEPSAQGLPIEIYAFTSTTQWEDYEDIQADIFDHIFAVLPEFGLVAHEAPTGKDISEISKLQKHVS